jgi:hypothetical protein
VESLRIHNHYFALTDFAIHGTGCYIS